MAAAIADAATVAAACQRVRDMLLAYNLGDGLGDDLRQLVQTYVFADEGIVFHLIGLPNAGKTMLLNNLHHFFTYGDEAGKTIPRLDGANTPFTAVAHAPGDVILNRLHFRNTAGIDAGGNVSLNTEAVKGHIDRCLEVVSRLNRKKHVFIPVASRLYAALGGTPPSADLAGEKGSVRTAIVPANHNINPCMVLTSAPTAGNNLNDTPANFLDMQDNVVEVNLISKARGGNRFVINGANVLHVAEFLADTFLPEVFRMANEAACLLAAERRTYEVSLWQHCKWWMVLGWRRWYVDNWCESSPAGDAAPSPYAPAGSTAHPDILRPNDNVAYAGPFQNKFQWAAGSKWELRTNGERVHTDDRGWEYAWSWSKFPRLSGRCLLPVREENNRGSGSKSYVKRRQWTRKLQPKAGAIWGGNF